MADIQTMERALKNAHSAGDTAAAKKLAQAIISARSQSQPDFDPASVALPDINLAEARAETNRREYENLPMWQKPLVALDDMATIFGDSASYGLVAKGAATVRSKLKGTPYEKERAAMDRMVSDAKDRAGGAGLAASIGGAVAVPAKLAARGVTFTNVPKVGGLLGLTADGAAMGAADAFGHDEDPAMGAVSGGAFGAGGQLVGGLLGKVISPFKGSPEREVAAKFLKKEGVDLTAGQRTGNKNLRFAEGEMGGSAATDFMEKQGEQFTAAALKRVGTKANRATPDVIDDTFNRIGNDFEQLSSRNNLVADPQIAQDLTRAAVDYGSVVSPSLRAPVVENVIDDTLTLLQKQGFMDGRAYQKHTSSLRTLARKTKEPELKSALNEIVESLDDAMERSIAKFNAQDLGAWGKTRKQYRNLMVVEQAATGAGENAATGLISPSALRNATVQKHTRRSYARGKGDFAELARSGEATMKALPDSGTASRLRANMLPHLLGAGVGAGYGGTEGGASGALIGGIGGAVAPYAIGRGLLSSAGRAYLGNQAAGKIPLQTKQALARMLAASGSSGLLGYQ